MNSERQMQAKTGQKKKNEAVASPGPAAFDEATPARDAAYFQKKKGNQSLLRLLRSGALHPKLTVSRPDDLYEQEADRVANEVMRMPDAAISGSQSGIYSREEIIQTKPGRPFAKGSQEGDKEKIKMSRKPDTVARAADSSVSDSFVSSLGAGSPLDRATRNYFEPRFGIDLSHVRLHADARAAESAKEINARAFTLGSNIVFGPGRYSPETSEGKSLLAHELTHVMQQNHTADHNISSESMIQAAFEDEPISAGSNADTLVTRIQGILREWKSECQEGVNDFVHAELAASIDALGSGSWPNFLVALIGNTIWAAAAFVPVVGQALTVAQTARAAFALSMAGIAVNAAPGVPSASSEGENLVRISLLLKSYFGEVFTGLMDQINPTVTRYVRSNPTQTGNQALITFLRDNFELRAINTTGTPNINGNEVRAMTQRKAADLLSRYRRQVLPIGPATTVNQTDPIDRQVTTQTGIAWARHANGTGYLTLLDIENSAIAGRQRGTHIVFQGFIDNDLRQSAIDRAALSQPRGIQTIPWALIRNIPENAPATVARQ